MRFLSCKTTRTWASTSRSPRKAPPLKEVAPGHIVACHLADKLTLRGVSAARL
jgi:hypothetical protein